MGRARREDGGLALSTTQAGVAVAKPRRNCARQSVSTKQSVRRAAHSGVGRREAARHCLSAHLILSFPIALHKRVCANVTTAREKRPSPSRPPKVGTDGGIIPLRGAFAPLEGRTFSVDFSFRYEKSTPPRRAENKRLLLTICRAERLTLHFPARR